MNVEIMNIRGYLEHKMPIWLNSITKHKYQKYIITSKSLHSMKVYFKITQTVLLHQNYRVRRESVLHNERESLIGLTVICGRAEGVGEADLPATRSHPNPSGHSLIHSLTLRGYYMVDKS